MSESWQRISEIFHVALARSPAEREAFVAAACAGDDDLRRQVQSLLAYEGRSDPFLEPSSHAESLVGRAIGIYEVLSVIGAGGMGVVYRARDTRLGRHVALKILPPDMLDAERRARFQREAQVLATLNHPNIATIYGMEEVDGISALVLELIDGSTLADVIRQGPVPVPRALAITRQIADALKGAHARGVVHRDLKPANIGITHDGTVKVLDFGLAKAVAEASTGRASVTTIGVAAMPVMLGTPGYMSPEQARGVGVDTRTDIWAFGCVLYEMLAGRPAFDGETVADILAAVNEREPDWRALPNALPDDARHLLRRCLSKDPARRPTDVLAALETPQTPSKISLARIAVVTTVVVAGWLGISPISRWLAHSEEEELVPVPLTSYPGLEAEPSFSPDGTQVAFRWNGPTEDNFDIYTKSIGPGDPHRLTTDPGNDAYPFWSPDGQWIAFAHIDLDPELPLTMYVIPASGGGARRIGPGFPQGWSPDSKWLLVSRGPATKRPPGLWLVSPTTGAEQQVTSRPPSQLDQGRLSLDGKVLAIKRNVGATSIAALLVQPLSDELKALGTARELPLDRRIRFGTDAPMTWVGDSTEIVYSAGWDDSERHLWRVRADGASRPVRLSFAGDGAFDPAISRDGHRLAFAKSLIETNIWSLTLDASHRAAGPPVRVFDSSRSELCPAFSPDGTRVAFESYRSGSGEIWRCATDGSGCTQLTSFRGPHAGSPAWSPDGSRIAFDGSGENGSEIYVIGADGGEPTRLGPGVVPRWSTDGRWIYYSRLVAGNPPQLLYRIPSNGGEAQPIESARGGWVPQQTDDGSLYYSMNPNAARTRIHRVGGGNTSTEVLSDVAGRNFVVTNEGIWYFRADVRNATLSLHQPAELHFYEFASRTSRAVYRTERPVAYGMALSPDGGRLLFTQLDRWGTDLMLVDHFR